MRACLLVPSCLSLPRAAAAAAHAGWKPKKLQRARLEKCKKPQSVQSHASSPPILLSRLHNLPSPSQSRHVKGEYFASPTPTQQQQQQQQQFARIRMEISATLSRTHARTHARNPPSGVALPYPAHRPHCVICICTPSPRLPCNTPSCTKQRKTTPYACALRALTTPATPPSPRQPTKKGRRLRKRCRGQVGLAVADCSGDSAVQAS